MTGSVSEVFFYQVLLSMINNRNAKRAISFTHGDDVVLRRGVSTVIFVGSSQQDRMSGHLGMGGRSQKTEVRRD